VRPPELGEEMRALRFAVFVGVVTGLFATAAAAKDYAHSGFFIAANGVAAVPEDDSFETDVGPSLRMGARFAERWSLEGQAEYSGEMDPELHEGTLTLNCRYALATGRVQPYALVGAGFGWMHDDSGSEEVWEASPAVRLGGGLELYVTEKFGFLGEVTHNLLTDSGARDYTSIGWGAFVRF
jgi:opacity protein-like surface antigen